MIIAIKMNLDKIYASLPKYVLDILKFWCILSNHFSTLFVAKSEFQVLVGNKIKICVRASFEKKFDFSRIHSESS